MTNEESNLVQAVHLARKAYLYIRQSSPRQVAENTETCCFSCGCVFKAKCSFSSTF